MARFYIIAVEHKRSVLLQVRRGRWGEGTLFLEVSEVGPASPDRDERVAVALRGLIQRLYASPDVVLPGTHIYLADSAALYLRCRVCHRIGHLPGDCPESMCRIPGGCSVGFVVPSLDGTYAGVG